MVLPMKTNAKKEIRFPALLLCLAVLLTALPLAAVGASAAKKATYDDIKNDETEALRTQLEELKKALKDTSEALDSADARQADAEEKRALYLTMKALYDNTVDTYEQELVVLEGQLEQLGKEMAALQLQYDESYANFLELLRMTYEEGSANYIEIILGAADISDLLSRVDRVRAMVGYNDRLMERLETEQQELDEKYKELEQKTVEQEKAIEEVEAKKLEVETWEKENEAALAAIEAEIETLIADSDNYGERVDVLDAEFQKMVDGLLAAENKKRAEEEERARQAAIAAAERKRLQEEEARRKAAEEAAKNQKYLWPLPYSYGRNYVTSLFGTRFHPIYKKYMTHYGIDIGAPAGTSIYAAKDGKVVTAAYHYSYGFYILLDHQDGTQTLYAHCTKLNVTAGTYVKRGQVIATVGSTGASTGAHLHLEIRVNGTQVDPLKYFVAP